MILTTRQLQTLKAAPNSVYGEIMPEFLFHSNRMEGSTFSEAELQRLVDEGVVCGEHDLDDVLETRNSIEVFGHVVDTLGEPVTPGWLCDLNARLFRGTTVEREGFSGHYKTIANRMRGASVSLAYPREVPGAVDELLARWPSPSSVEEVARFHSRFEHIHPFQDGNGRIGRFLIMKQCVEAGIDLVLIDSEEERPYKRWLEVSQADGDFRFLVQTFERCQARLDEKARGRGWVDMSPVPEDAIAPDAGEDAFRASPAAASSPRPSGPGGSRAPV